jgi:hypothetical protein
VYIPRPPLVIVRKLVPHVEHRLLVHCFVLQDGERRFGAVEQRMAGAIGDPRAQAHRVLVGPLQRQTPAPRHVSATGCVRPSRHVRIVRIYPARKQLLEASVDTRLSERPLDQRVEAERRQVALIDRRRADAG